MRSIIRFLNLPAFVLLLVLSAVAVLAQAQMTPQQKELADYIKLNYTKREVMIPMRDGVRLFTSIYMPRDASQKYPIMFQRTPYTVAPYGEDKFAASLGPNDLFAREGYIFAYQDVRGQWMSEGEFENMRPYVPNKTGREIDETTDTYDTVDWLIKNVPNNNGRVGVYGISYPGFYTSMAGIDGHPAIKAISPQAPVSNWFHGDDLHHNGALFLAQNYNVVASFGQPRPKPMEWSPTAIKQFPWGTRDGYNFYLRMGGLKNSGDLYKQKLGARIKFWDEMMQHPNYDQFWKARNVLPNLKNIHAAVMTVGGWYDNEDLFGALKTYEHIERQDPGIFNVLVMGPWSHGGWWLTDGDWLGTAYFGQKTGPYFREHFELPFFNYFLKGKGDIVQIKKVNVFDTGADEWRALPNWPPQASAETPLYLQAKGKLSFTQNTRGAPYDEYVSDPMNPVPYTQKITPRPDVLVYQTDPLTDDITVAGDIKPQIFISSSGTDSDFVIKLIDVFPDDYQYPESGNKLPNGQPERVKPPDTSTSCIFSPGGYEMLLRGEPFPARFRNSFEKPQPLRPSVPTKISYVMPGIVHTFKKGHRIMVQIQSTWFPLVARNPQRFVANYQMATDADFQKATERVYHTAAEASQIVLPVLRK